MFEVNNLPAGVNSINVRAENHGKDHALAVDLVLVFIASNSVLNQLDVNLLHSLYRREDDPQQLIDVADGSSTALRFPQIKKFPWDYKGAGYECHLDPNDLFEGNTVVLSDCAVNDFAVEPQEGGTVKLKVRVQAHPDEPTVGRLSGFLKEQVQVTLIPPSAPEQGDIEDDQQEAA